MREKSFFATCSSADILAGFAFALFPVSVLANPFYSPIPATAPAPLTNPTTPAKVELGKKLYFDPRLSADGTVSCNSCHNVMAGGEDNRPTSVGIRGQKGGRSAPTVWNAAFMSVQFWDGRAASLEEQAKGPLTNPIEMGMKDHDAVISVVNEIPEYQAEFAAAFPGEKSPVTIDNLARSIAAFERTLITSNSRFDRFLNGDQKALSSEEKRGLDLVQSVGCVSCHSGVNFAGPSLPEGSGFFQRFPVFENNKYLKQYQLKEDTGRFSVTKQAADRYMWRVPGWRNIALTAPYFHNGSVASLDEAVRVMAKTQLNRDVPSEDVQSIVAFLGSLTGEFPKVDMPRLPSTPGFTVSAGKKQPAAKPAARL
jgi:cytochrome c peroxidase